jgi:hypothetical protein
MAYYTPPAMVEHLEHLKNILTAAPGCGIIKPALPPCASDCGEE